MVADVNLKRPNAVCQKSNSSRAKGQNTKSPVVPHCRHRHCGDGGKIPAAVADSTAVSHLVEMAVANVSVERRRTPAVSADYRAEDQLAERAAASVRVKRQMCPVTSGLRTEGSCRRNSTP